MPDAIAVVVTFGLVAFIIAGIVGVWKVFTKAGEPGWACLVPIYNLIVLLRIAGKPWYWLLLEMIPIVGLYFVIVTMVDLAKNFGKGVGFAVGLILLGGIFFPILGFSDAEYLGPGGLDAPRRKSRRRDTYEEEDAADDARARRRARGRREDFEEPEDRSRRRAPREESDEVEERPARRLPPPEDFEEDRPARRAAPRPPDDDLDDLEEVAPRRPVSRDVSAGPPRRPAAQDARLIPCTGCHRKLRVPASAIGKRVQCPGCGATLVVE